jgi:hypothetical protein
MWVVAAVVLLVVVLWPTPGRRRGRPLFRSTGPQWRRGYGRRAFLRLGTALGVAAVLAYSGADEAVERWHTGTFDPREHRAETVRDEMRAEGRKHEANRVKTGSFPSSASDRVAQVVEPLGDREWFFIWGLGGLADWLWRTNPASRWARANFEAMCVGLPTLWTFQRVLGSNRPSSDDGSPRWRPFQHANAASGHAFLGAIPLWTLARRLRPRWASAAAGALGTLTGWSRINDRKHYLSQVILGWTIAYNAVDATDATRDGAEPREIEAGIGGAR